MVIHSCPNLWLILNHAHVRTTPSSPANTERTQLKFHKEKEKISAATHHREKSLLFVFSEVNWLKNNSNSVLFRGPKRIQLKLIYLISKIIFLAAAFYLFTLFLRNLFSSTVGGNGIICTSFLKSLTRIKTLKFCITFDPIIHLLDLIFKDKQTRVQNHMQKLIVALFLISFHCTLTIQ